MVEHSSYLVALIDDDVGEVLHACLEALRVVRQRKRHGDGDARLADLDMRMAAVVDASGVLLAGIAVEADLLQIACTRFARFVLTDDNGAFERLVEWQVHKCGGHFGIEWLLVNKVELQECLP